jgi:hypothetical protein
MVFSDFLIYVAEIGQEWQLLLMKTKGGTKLQ